MQQQQQRQPQSRAERPASSSSETQSGQKQTPTCEQPEERSRDSHTFCPLVVAGVSTSLSALDARIRQGQAVGGRVVSFGWDGGHYCEAMRHGVGGRESEAFGMALSLAAADAVRRCTSIWRSSLRNMLPSGAEASRRVGRAKSMSISVSTMMGRAVLTRLGRSQAQAGRQAGRHEA